MELSKDIIKRLKDLGFTQEDIAELDRLSYVYDQNGLYKKIGSMNNAMLETDIRPVYINIDNIEKRLKHDKKATPKIIISEYQKEERVLKGGATSALESFYDQIVLELTRYGINATPEQLYELYNTNDYDISRLEEIILWFRRYITLIEEGVQKYVSEGIVYASEANDIISNYSGIDMETGELL